MQVFFDGKERENLSTGEKKECVSVAVSGPGMDKEKFLGDQEVEKGTGVLVARVVCDLLALWGLTPATPGPTTIAFTIDTCTVNMGRDHGKN